MENTVRGRDQRTLNYSKIPCERVSRTYCLLASTAALFLSKLRYGRHSAVPFLSVLSVQHLLSCRTSSSFLLLLLSNLLRCWKSNFVRDQNKRRLHAAIIINAIPTLGKRQQLPEDWRDSWTRSLSNRQFTSFPSCSADRIIPAFVYSFLLIITSELYREIYRQYLQIWAF